MEAEDSSKKKKGAGEIVIHSTSLVQYIHPPFICSFVWSFKKEDFKNPQNQPVAVMASSLPGAASQRRKRNHPGNPSPDAEVVALSPNTLTATNQFSCEVCYRGFQREQNLQLHMRGHNLPWKLKQRTSQEARKKVYVCPELNCVHHDPSRALGDLTGIKKHFCRKHGDKKYTCDKCEKKYAVLSDLKSHNKICGTREYKCDCGSTFSRRSGLINHHSICQVFVGKVARHTTNGPPRSSSMSASAGIHANVSNLPLHPIWEPELNIPRASEYSEIHGFPSNLAPSNMFDFGFDGSASLNIPQIDLDLNINNSLSGVMLNAESSCNTLNSTPSPQFSATALLHKAKLTESTSNTGNVSIGDSVVDSAEARHFLGGQGPEEECSGILGKIQVGNKE
nr:PREDICTED: protein indeterminate-domain 11-like [Daucus carota subsp. sativus]